MKTLLIMPAWNEAPVIGQTIAAIRSAAPHYELLVVDDGSDDDTASIARAGGAMVLALPFNLGVGGAMRAGYQYARRHGVQRALQIDADGQHDPADIEIVLEGLERANISIGARFDGRGDNDIIGPRRWAMRFLAAVVSRVAQTRLTDVTSGFRAADSRAIDQYCRHYPVEYLGDTVDSLVGAVRSGLAVTQVPVAMRPRQAGERSTGPIRSTLCLLRSLLALLIALTRRTERAR